MRLIKRLIEIILWWVKVILISLFFATVIEGVVSWIWEKVISIIA